MKKDKVIYADLNISYEEYQKQPFNLFQRYGMYLIGAVAFAPLAWAITKLV